MISTICNNISNILSKRINLFPLLITIIKLN